MLYSMNFIRALNRRMRMMFYAEDKEKAREYLRTIADGMALDESEVWLECHPHGFIFQREKLGPRYWPPEEPQKCR